jgi:2'-5' RNA ligase
MHYVLLIYPTVGEDLVGRIRRTYDPTVDVVRPHVPVVYPVPESLGRERLVAHIQTVVAGSRPFEIRFGGLCKSPDHWLFLTLAQGREHVEDLHRSLHTGLLAEFGAGDREFVPHLGLGLFLREGATYDWENPRADDFDAPRYEAALREAQALCEGPAERIDTLHLVTTPDEVLEWSSGERSAFSSDVRAAEVHAFRMGA